MVECYIALGSNLDSPKNRILKAISQIKRFSHTLLVNVSSLYRSPPWGVTLQPDFINAVVKLKTALSAEHLLKELLALEKLHGRIRNYRWGPRTLDCDLLLYHDQSINEPNLTVPHPRMTERVFVLLPLAEIAPRIIVNEQPISTWVSRCDSSQIEKLILSKEELMVYETK